MDTNQDGVIEWSEFRAVVFPPPPSEMDIYMQNYENYLRAVFERIDEDQSGSLSYGEIAEALRDEDVADALGLSGSGLTSIEFSDRLLASLDWDDDCEITWDEFRGPALATAVEAFAKTRLEIHLRHVFERVDRDGSGFISIEECVEALQ